jgi:hypothetical protein
MRGPLGGHDSRLELMGGLLRYVARTLLAVTFMTSLMARVPAAQAQTPGRTVSPPRLMPVRYDEHRYILAPVTDAGDTLYLYSDTGSEITALFPAAVERLGLARDSLVRGQDTFRFTTFPRLRPMASIPFRSVHPKLERAILVVDSIPFAAGTDGLLGTAWFAGRVWTFDYPKHQLLLRVAGDLPRQSARHRVALGFQTDSAGRRTVNLPRIRVLIYGDSLDLLFDTGAMTVLTDSAHIQLSDGRAARRAASFVVQSVFDRWRQRHPRWRVIERADQLLGNARFPMIEVPELEVGGFTVGPVWLPPAGMRTLNTGRARWTAPSWARSGGRRCSTCRSPSTILAR